MNIYSADKQIENDSIIEQNTPLNMFTMTLLSYIQPLNRILKNVRNVQKGHTKSLSKLGSSCFEDD